MASKAGESASEKPNGRCASKMATLTWFAGTCDTILPTCAEVSMARRGSKGVGSASSMIRPRVDFDGAGRLTFHPVQTLLRLRDSLAVVVAVLLLATCTVVSIFAQNEQ